MPSLYEYAVDAARRYGVDPRVFTAQINQESGFQNVPGRAGEFGPGQFMPGTWTMVINQHPEIAEEFGVSADPGDRGNAVANIYAAAAHMADLLAALEGDYRNALAAYNGGLGGYQGQQAQNYAATVLAAVGRTPPSPEGAPSVGAPGLPRMDIGRLLAQVRARMAARAPGVSAELLGPLEGLVEAVRQRSQRTLPRPLLPTEGTAATPAGITERVRSAASQWGGQRLHQRSVQEIQVEEAIRAAIERAGRSRAGPSLGRAGQPVSRAQFGSIVSGLQRAGGAIADVVGPVVSPIAEAVAPVVRPIGRALEWEQEQIGRPVARAVLTPFRPLLPEPIERGTEAVLSALLVPSTLIPFPGLRTLTAGSIMGRTLFRGILSPADLPKTARIAAQNIRLLYKSQARWNGLIAGARRAVINDPDIMERRLIMQGLEKARTSLGKRVADLRDVSGPGLAKAEAMLKTAEREIRNARQDAYKLGLTRTEDLFRSPTAPVLEAAEELVKANETVARYNSSKMLFWMRHRRGVNSELLDSLRTIVRDPLGVPPPGLSPKQEGLWRETNAWITRLFVEGPHDPLAEPEGFLNFFARKWNPLRGLVRAVVQPIADLPDALSGVMITGQRLAMSNGQTQRMLMAAMEHGIIAEFGTEGLTATRVLLAAYKGQAPSLLARNAARTLFKEAEAEGKPLTREAQRRILAGLLRDYNATVGTIAHAMRRSDDYVLTDDQRNLFKFISDTFRADGEEVAALGGSIGFVDDLFYLPQRRAMGQETGIGRFSRIGMARSFKERKIPDFNDFIARAAADNETKEIATELNVSRLLDWRLGMSARKKAQQMTYALVENHPEMVGLIERPLKVRAGGKVATEFAEELTELNDEELARAIANAFDAPFGDAEALANEIRKAVPGTRNKRIADFYFAKERRLVPASRIPESQAELRTMARNLEDWAMGRLGEEGLEAKGLEGIVQRFRNVFLTMDLSPYAFVQGARVFAQDPVSYFRQIGSAAAWNMTDSGRRIQALQNAPALSFWAGHGLQLGHPMDVTLPRQGIKAWSRETWEETKRTFVAPGLSWLNREMMDMVGFAKLHIANTTYGTLLAAKGSPEIRLMLKGLPWFESIQKRHPDWEKMPNLTLPRAIADGLNNYFGPLEIAKIRPGQRFSAIEQLMLLTPSWTRGNIGSILNAPKLGVKGTVARNLYMNQLALQTMMATKLSLAATGRLPNYDPRSNEFLSAQLPWGRVHLMPAMPVMRMPARILAGRPEAERFEEESIWKEKWEDLSRFWEGRMGQLPRVLIDLASGEDFIGRKVEPSVLYFIQQAAPIALQEIWETFEEGKIPRSEIVQRAFLSGMGASNIPKTPMRQYREKVEMITGRPFKDENGERTFTRQEMRELEAKHPDLVSLQKRAEKYRAARADPVTEFFQAERELRESDQKVMSEWLDRHAEGMEDYERLYADISEMALRARGEFRSNVGDFLDISNKVIGKEEPNRLDQVAFAFWGLDPEEFIDLNGQQRSINAAYSAATADDIEQELDDTWRAWYEKRQSLLTTDEERRYVLTEFPRGRWDDPRAQELEIRRVGAQQVLTQYFNTARYRWPSGRVFSQEEERALQEIRDERDNILGRLVQEREAAFTAGLLRDPALPSGTTERILRALHQRETDPQRRSLIAWENLWRRERAREGMGLRNPERDLILVQNPDAILFYHKRLWRSPIEPPRRLLRSPLARNPEIARILSGAR